MKLKQSDFIFNHFNHENENNEPQKENNNNQNNNNQEAGYYSVDNIRTSKTYTVHLDSTFSTDANFYQNIRKTMTQIKPNDSLNLYINSFGGSVYVLTEVSQLLKNKEYNLHIHVTGVCMSAASILVLSLFHKAKSITIGSSSSIMFHKGMALFLGKPNEVKSQYKHFEQENQVFLDIYEFFLPKKWRKEIEDEKECWIMGYDFAKRLAKVRDKKNFNPNLVIKLDHMVEGIKVLEPKSKKKTIKKLNTHYITNETR